MRTRDPLILPLDGSVDAPAALVGGKAANLAELTRIGMPVPPAICITAMVYEEFLAAQSREFHTALQQVAEGQPVETLMAVAVIPSRVRSVVVEAYHLLCRRLDMCEPLVAVRSSGTCEDSSATSFAGQFHTELYCRGESEVIAGVLRVWLSALDPRPAGYTQSQGIDPRSIIMPVVLQHQIAASVSGTGFSVDLESGCPMIAIHATYGLGTSVVDGSVSPDAYLLDPDSLVVLSRRLGNKIETVEYDWALRAAMRRETSTHERQAYSLSDSTLTEVAELVRRAHAHFRTHHGWQHIDLEFAVQKGHVWLTQGRPETAWSRRKTEGPLAVDREKAVSLQLILEGGSTGFPGVLTGPLRVVRSVSEAEERVRPGDILVTTATTNVWEMALAVAGGAVTDVGGPSCHTAIVLREQGRPCLVGTHSATERLAAHDDRLVTLDATQRAVFLGSTPPEWLTASASDFRPFHGTADCETNEEVWHSIPEGRTGKTVIDADGSRWIMRPGKRAITPFMQSIVGEGYRRMSDRLGVPVATRVQNGVHLVSFDDLWAWRLKLRGMPLESLERLHIERLEAVQAFLAATRDLDSTAKSLGAWMDAFIAFNSWMSIAYTFAVVAEGLFRSALTKRRVPALYVSRIECAAAAQFGETETTRALGHYKALFDEAHERAGLREVLREVRQDSSVANLPRDFADRLGRYATQYKVTKEIDFTLTQNTASLSVIDSLLRDIEKDRRICLPQRPTVSEEFFPGQDHFHRLARLCFRGAKLREDAHHQRVRGMWRFLDAVDPVIQCLLRLGQVQEREQVFGHSCQWLLERCREYSRCRPRRRSARH